MKTIKEWLETIEDEIICERALDNMSEGCINFIPQDCTLSRAISYAFYWNDSPEGNDYWNNICYEYEKQGL